MKVKINVHEDLKFLHNLEVSSDGYSRDESSEDDFASKAQLVLVPPKDNNRKTNEDSSSEDDLNPSCLNKYQLLAEDEVNLCTTGGNIILNDACFSQASFEWSPSESQLSSIYIIQPSQVSREIIVYSTLPSVCGT